MRKLFSILAVALLALSAHATVMTQDISLDSFEPYNDEQGTFNSSTLVFTSSIAWGAGQIWIGDDNTYALDAYGWNYIGLDLASAASEKVSLTVEYTTADGTTAQSMVLPAGKTSQLLKLNGRYIKKIEIKNNSSTAVVEIAFSRLYLYKAGGVSSESVLFNESRDLGSWVWDSRVVLPATDFVAAHDGDELIISYTSGASGQCALRVQDLETGSNLLNEPGEYAPIETSATGDLTVVLRASDITNLQAHGMYITGQDLTITKVKLITYAAQMMTETQLASGSIVLDWNEVYNTTSFPTLSAGDELHVVLSDIDESNNYQVIFRNGWEDDANIITTISGITSSDDVPKVYSVTLTAEQATAFNNESRIFVTGTGVTIARLAIAQPMSIYDESILWSGEQTVTNDWSGGIIIAKEALTDLKEGNIICVQLSAVGGDDYGDQVLLKYGDSWADFSPAVNYLFPTNLAAPMTVEIPVTAKMRDQLRGNKLVVTGKDYTMTHIFVKEGTPVNTNSHFLTVTSAGMATLVLPFDVPALPDGVQAYNLTNNGDATIFASEVTSLTADQPVLIIAPEGEYEFVSEEGASDDISTKTGTYTNGALIGTYTTIDPLDQQTAGNYNYILQNGAEGVGFYQVRDNTCSVAPYRAYLNCGYNNAGTPSSAPRMRIVFHENTTTGIEDTVSATFGGSTKILRNGQILILRNGMEYNATGVLVK